MTLSFANIRMVLVEWVYMPELTFQGLNTKSWQHYCQGHLLNISIVKTRISSFGEKSSEKLKWRLSGAPCGLSETPIRCVLQVSGGWSLRYDGMVCIYWIRTCEPTEDTHYSWRFIMLEIVIKKWIWRRNYTCLVCKLWPLPKQIWKEKTVEKP